MKEVTSIINIELTFITEVEDDAVMPNRENLEQLFKQSLAGKADKVEVKGVKHFERKSKGDK